MGCPVAEIHQASKDSREYQRYRQNKAKWAHGVRPRAGDKNFSDGDRGRPRLVRHTRCRSCLGGDLETQRYGPQKFGRRPDFEEDISSRHNVDDYDSLSPDDRPEQRTGDIYYSFDARRVPTHGQDTLSVALNRALDRFDTKETERLVREYDFVSESDGSELGEPLADDEEYEFVDYLGA